MHFFRRGYTETGILPTAAANMDHRAALPVANSSTFSWFLLEYAIAVRYLKVAKLRSQLIPAMMVCIKLGNGCLLFSSEWLIS